MADRGDEPAVVDFDLAYRGETATEGLAFDRVPWDIGRPQPLLVEFEKAGSITGEVLDAGCGPGDTAVYLAGLGYRVTGLDIAATAIEKARPRGRTGSAGDVRGCRRDHSAGIRRPLRHGRQQSTHPLSGPGPAS